MANYRAIYLQQKDIFNELDSFDMTFIIIDENNDILTNASLQNFKFSAEITDDANEITKQDANYAGGSANEISISGIKVTVHVTENETDDWEGYYMVELTMTHKTNGNRYTN